MLLTIALAALAGVLSTLSPYVLPLVPVVVAAALSEHRLGLITLAVGLAASFTTIGLFVATIGFNIGLDLGVFRNAAAAALIAIGVVLMVPIMQARLAMAATPLANWTEQRFTGFSTSGLSGQFSVGLLLGAVWSPCVGPTLGAASLMAAQGENLGVVAATMLAFGIGASLPLVALGSLSRERLMGVRHRLLEAGRSGKVALGACLFWPVFSSSQVSTSASRRCSSKLRRLGSPNSPPASDCTSDPSPVPRWYLMPNSVVWPAAGFEHTQGESRMSESGLSGSVRGAISNDRSYRDPLQCDQRMLK